jgi:hypothetical protein
MLRAGNRWLGMRCAVPRNSARFRNEVPAALSGGSRLSRSPVDVRQLGHCAATPLSAFAAVAPFIWRTTAVRKGAREAVDVINVRAATYSSRHRIERPALQRRPSLSRHPLQIASLVTVLLAVLVGIARAEKNYDPGASDTEIKIGQTYALGDRHRRSADRQVNGIARQWADQILLCSPIAIRYTKQLALAALEGEEWTETMGQKRREISQSLHRLADFKEGVEAFMQKRKPVRQGR